MNGDTAYQLNSCPACSSADLARDDAAQVTVCEGCGSIFTQAGIDALATGEHLTGPLDELDAQVPEQEPSL